MGTQTELSISSNNGSLHDHTYCYNLYNNNNLWNHLLHIQQQLEIKQEELNKLKETIGQLQQELNSLEERRFCLDRFKEDSKAIQFYTGFQNYNALIAYYNYLEPKVSKLQYW